MTEIIEYNISMYPTKEVTGKHYTRSKKILNPLIRIYISKLSERINDDIEENLNYIKKHFDCKEDAFFNYFSYDLNYIIVLERICLECRLNNTKRIELGLGKKRIQGRCKPFKKHLCKMDYITTIIFDYLQKN